MRHFRSAYGESGVFEILDLLPFGEDGSGLDDVVSHLVLLVAEMLHGDFQRSYKDSLVTSLDISLW
jgi:hypothetical protein